jgi:hypothetical protein
MDSPAAKPGHVRKDLPDPAEAESAKVDPAPKTDQPLPFGWRIALFIWLSAAGFLIVYELISVIFRLLKIR